MSRKSAREEAFKIIFESEILNENLSTILKNYLSKNLINNKENDKNFLVKVINGVNEHIDKIMNLINNNLENWNFDRIGYIEKAILKEAVFELLNKENPLEIVVDEAVELSKKYGTEKTPDFINGVLAKIIKSI